MSNRERKEPTTPIESIDIHPPTVCAEIIYFHFVTKEYRGREDGLSGVTVPVLCGSKMKKNWLFKIEELSLKINVVLTLVKFFHFLFSFLEVVNFARI